MKTHRKDWLQLRHSTEINIIVRAHSRLNKTCFCLQIGSLLCWGKVGATFETHISMGRSVTYLGRCLLFCLLVIQLSAVCFYYNYFSFLFVTFLFRRRFFWKYNNFLWERAWCFRCLFYFGLRFATKQFPQSTKGNWQNYNKHEKTTKQEEVSVACDNTGIDGLDARRAWKHTLPVLRAAEVSALRYFRAPESEPGLWTSSEHGTTLWVKFSSRSVTWRTCVLFSFRVLFSTVEMTQTLH